jgi:formamidopyrimidine-DNA glycosylase
VIKAVLMDQARMAGIGNPSATPAVIALAVAPHW